MTLSLSLRILSVLYWWYLVVFVWSVLPMLGVQLMYVPPFRGAAFAWDYELFFAAIACVWGYFLWRSARNLLANRTFILFTLWATASHLVAMIVVGVIRPDDMTHLLLDASVWIVPLLAGAWGYKRELA